MVSLFASVTNLLMSKHFRTNHVMIQGTLVDIMLVEFDFLLWKVVWWNSYTFTFVSTINAYLIVYLSSNWSTMKSLRRTFVNFFLFWQLLYSWDAYQKKNKNYYPLVMWHLFLAIFDSIVNKNYATVHVGSLAVNDSVVMHLFIYTSVSQQHLYYLFLSEL